MKNQEEHKRTEFLRYLWELVDYWHDVEGRSEREKLAGLVHSILTAIDGMATAIGGFDLVDDFGNVVNANVLLNDMFFQACPDKNHQIHLEAGTRIKHYKGGFYKVLAVGTHSENQEQMVTYQETDKDGNLAIPTFQAAFHPDHEKIWIRPFHMFQEMVTLDNGEQVPRFQVVS